MTAPYLQLLGEVSIRLEADRLRFKPERRYQLLAYLAYRGDWLSREALAYLFWPDSPQATARRNLRKLLFKTRQLGWLENLEVDERGLRWLVQTDVAAFLNALQQKGWQEALRRYGGPLLASMEGEETTEFALWLALERERLASRWRDAALQRAKELERERRYREAAALLHDLLEQDDFDEAALRAYMASSSRAGEPAQALRAYHDFAQRLEAELGLEPASETRQLLEAIQSGDRAALERLAAPPQPPAALSPPVAEAGLPQPHALPVAPTPLVGRELELAELAGLLRQPEGRLLTLVGPGGVGKSRIALQAAYEAGAHYRDGVVFVSLEDVSAPSLIATKIAEALGSSFRGSEEPLAQVARHLEARRMLVVLDNFEQLTEGAPLLSELLRMCPHLKLLVTSRARLALEEEWLLPVAGLPFPEQEAVELEKARRYDAVQLFVQRARRVRPQFALTAADLPHVLAICRLVEGFPLGLELAAVWVRLMSCADIAQEIQKSADFLAHSSRNLPPRQQSIRATFEHSWQLLTPREQEALRKLSVFRGGFTREAARYVAGAPLAVLASLVDKSLLRVSGTGRYDRHPLLYQYTQEKLAEKPLELADAREKHASFYAEHVNRSHKLVKEGRQQDFVQRLSSEHENLLAMWEWGISQRHEAVISKATKRLMAYLTTRGLRKEALALLARAAEVFTQATHTRLVILNRQGALYLTSGRWKEAQTCLKEARRLTPAHSDLLEKGITLMQLGRIADMVGSYDDAQRLWETCLAIFRKLDNPIAISEITHALGLAAHHKGDSQKAIRLQHESLALKEHLGHTSGTGFGQLFLGDVHLDLEAYTEAKSCYEASLSAFQQLGNDNDAAHALKGLAKVALRTGDAPSAGRYLQECLSIFKRSDNRSGLVEALGSMGDLDLMLGHGRDARRHYLEALALAQQAALTPLILYALGRLVLSSNLPPGRKLTFLRYIMRHRACSAGLKLELEAPAAALASQYPRDELGQLEELAATLTLEAVSEEAVSGCGPA